MSEGGFPQGSRRCDKVSYPFGQLSIKSLDVSTATYKSTRLTTSQVIHPRS